MPDSSTSHRGLNILCIDGGGARGLLALVLIDEIMKRVQHLKNLDSPPKPHECFDLIAGTGTGAVQACMLGRLRMPVDSAIQAYARLTNDVFSERKRFGSGSFKTTRLRESLKRVIQEATGNLDELMMDPQQTGKCKTLVFAMSSRSMRAGIPTAFRSYPVNANEGPKCTIWETLCATMAHPDLFKPFEIGIPPLSQSFVDAGLGCNNPLVHVLAEVKTLYPGQYVASVTSIGTGHTRTIQIPDSLTFRHLLPIAAIVVMKSIATDSERVAEELARRFSSTKGVYFRLNVDQGLQNVGMDEWEQLGEVLEHTRAYMKLVEINQRIDQAAEAIHSRQPIAPIVQIDGGIQVEAANTTVFVLSTIRRCPAPTPTYTGCEHNISKIELCVSGNIVERRVCVVHGLGGAGKTQMVLKVVERTYDQWREVIFIDASTQHSIESALKDVAVSMKVGDGYEDALRWLESCRERWLVVFDNADDPSLPLQNYIPRGNHGSIIITTRLSGMVSLAQGPGSDCSVSSMDPGDALALLLKLARKQDQELPPEEERSAKALLQEFGHFALAVVHAGSFIGRSAHMSFTEYRSLFSAQQRQTLEAYTNLPAAVKADSYKHTVYTAWQMCHDSLSSRAQQLLWLIGFLHHTGITIDIFRRATINIVSHRPQTTLIPLEQLSLQTLHKLLSSFVKDDQPWDSLLFTQTINEITSWSLLEYDQLNQSYRIHVLVQSWIRTVVPWEADLGAGCARALLSISTPLDDGLESMMYRMRIGLHVDKVVSETPEGCKIGASHALAFAEIYQEREHWKRVEQFRLQIREAREDELGGDHPDTLLAIQCHAYTYSRLNRLDEARDLQIRVLDAQKRVLCDDHPDMLTTMHQLAITYSDLNRHEEARDLEVRVLDARKRVLGDDHPHTLRTMNNLAITYSHLNRLEEARDLEVRVVDAQKRVLGDDHPDTLLTMNNLAVTYSYLNRHEEARDLQVRVVDARKRVLGDDHPDTLSTMNNLAYTYLELGLWEQAELLLINLDTFVRVLGENHKYTRTARERLKRIQSCREKHAGTSSWTV